MKILYSQIKQLVPDLIATPTEVGEALTMTGIMQESLDQVNYNGQPDTLLGLEVRQNRADCFSIIGIAREVAAYFNLELKLPVAKEWQAADLVLPIRVETTEVRRLKAVKLSNPSSWESPQWLIDYLAMYDLKSINLLVDLSNYVMILTGYASHLIDLAPIDGDIVWSVNDRPLEITTLDGSQVKLTSGELLIGDRHKTIALAGIVGTDYAAISPATTNFILEMAAYNPSVVRKNSRQLHIVTEASNKLEKYLSVSELAYAFDLLVNLLIEQAGVQVASSIFEYYPEVPASTVISFDPQLASQLAGVEITLAESQQILEQLGFIIDTQALPWSVTVPAWRTDLEMPEDLVEEVVRLYRYDRIPAVLPALKVTADITKPLTKLKEKWRDYLTARGWDEVLSWTMVTHDNNLETNYLDWEIASAINAINEDYTDLRQTVLASLVKQSREYFKKQVADLQIFEIGKVFGQKDGEYLEAEHLGWLQAGDNQIVENLRQTVAGFLAYNGITEITWDKLDKVPTVGNPYAVWQISLAGQPIGALLQLVDKYNGQTMAAAEIDADQLVKYLTTAGHYAPTVELTQKLVSLDANLELASRQALDNELAEIRAKVGRESLWSLAVTDEFALPNGQYRYTVRAVYKELDDQSAKKLHLQVFGLN
ncbi:MAG TPA: phenylalanine--tRNA ligase beta subunit-related protein [bacterium]|nr:phenylalanine--tRNA ligase beta subunit-related protein [bacterium]